MPRGRVTRLQERAKKGTLSDNRIVVNGAGNIALVVYSIVGAAPRVIIVPGESLAVRTLFAVCVESRIVSQAEPSLVGSCQFIDINQMHTVPTAGCPQRRRIASISSYIAQQHN